MQTLPSLKTFDHFDPTPTHQVDVNYHLESYSPAPLHHYQPSPPHLPHPQHRPSPSTDSASNDSIPPHPYPTPPMSSHYFQSPVPHVPHIPQMNPPNYYQSGAHGHGHGHGYTHPLNHRTDTRPDLNNQSQSQSRPSPHLMPGSSSQGQRYVPPPPHPGYGSDGSSSGYYGSTPSQSQASYGQYQQSPYSPYMPLAPPVHQLPPGPSPGPGPGPSGYMVSPPSKDTSVHSQGQTQSHGQSQGTAQGGKKGNMKKKSGSPKKKTSPMEGISMPSGREKWKWDVPDEVYARMNSEEKKQVRNRCGARAFRAKRKAEDAARAAGTEHLKQQVMMLHHQLNAARARLGEPPVDLPPLVPPEGFEASAECLGLGLDFQGAESDGSMEFT